MGLIPDVLLSEIQPRRFLDLDDVFSRFDVESVVAVAICRRLLEEMPARVIQVDANASDAFLTWVLNAILILVMPDAVSEDEICLRQGFRADGAIAVQGNFGLGKLAVEHCEMTRRAFGDEEFVDERREREACLRTRNRRKV